MTAHAEQIATTFGALLLRTNRAHLYDRLTAGVDGVDGTTYPVLSGLARTGPATASRLAELIGLDRTVTTRYATRLQKAGLVARAADADDARATRLSLTPEGRRAVQAMRAALGAIVADALSTSEPEEVEVFARVLQRLLDALAPGA
ncbi:MarR family transcriptional regulator [Actinomadura sp. DC4]|uniref:MarR family winged helix-turn-helix transcriptional regulator n=1 Tax=Actinomadura sp. DC4 TaxID=3055069 RepID=UPI0025AFBCDF|nr:MarR family transcriptional regulator [Actinomadura sp. DC4]MDN3351858.1 MarR family transcriptional regulator [Actinomadura sp. DC4]